MNNDITTVEDLAHSQTSVEIRPVFGSREEARSYLRSNIYRKHDPRRVTAATGDRGEPNRRHIAVVQHADGRVEILHATKGWRKGRI